MTRRIAALMMLTVAAVSCAGADSDDPTPSTVAAEALEAVLSVEGDPAGAVLIVHNRTGLIIGTAVRGESVVDHPLEGGSRPAGSIMKALVLAVALDAGFPLDRDIPAPQCVDVDGRTACGGDGIDVQLAEATVDSINPAYVSVAWQIGPERIADTGRRLGMALPPSGAIPLGVDPVSMYSVAALFVAIAADGETLAIGTLDGEVVLPAAGPLMTAEAATAARSILRSVVTDGTGMLADGADEPWGKTGTAEFRTDGWFAGSTTEHTIVVWVGSADGSTRVEPPLFRDQLAGSGWPAAIWRRVADGIATP